MTRTRSPLLAAVLSLAAASGAAADATTDAMVGAFRTVCLGSQFDVDAAKAKLRALGWRPIDPALFDLNPVDSNTWVGRSGGIGLQVGVSSLSYFVCSVRGATSDFAGLKTYLSSLGGTVLLDEEISGMRMSSHALRLDGAAVNVGATVDGPAGSLVVSQIPGSR